ncbi:hypothetical protein HK104_005917, partial [Borealophlyctis nickersoniae]
MERFGPLRARVAHKLGADVRGEGGEMLRTMWEHLSATGEGKMVQAGFIPALVGPFLQLTMSPHPVLRGAAVELLFNTIEREFEQVGHFGRVEVECIERMHRLVTVELLGDESYRRFISDALARRFDTRRLLPDSSGPRLEAQGERFVERLDTFLDLSITIRDLPPADQHDDERMASIVKMMRFLRYIGRRGVYVKYVHKLVDLHIANQNFIEGALALKLHADLLEWRHDVALEPLEAFGYPHWQSEFDRKEHIYIRCCDLLERGQAWERAAEMLSELGCEYQRGAWDFWKLSEMLARQSGVYAKIVGVERYYPNYYRVGFYGKGFSTALRGKEFVYRGGDWEKIGPFCERVLSRYGGASLVRSNAPVGMEVLHSAGKHVQITSVKPVVDSRRWETGKSGRGPLGALHWESAEFGVGGEDGGGEAAVGDGMSDDDEEEVPLLLIEPDLDPYLGTSITPQTAVLDRVDEHTRAYYESNEVNMFTFSRPIRKPFLATSTPSSDPANEFLELWTEKTVLVTEDKFPCISRRSEVVRSVTFELSPIENAVIAVRSKSRQLLELERRYAGVAEGAAAVKGSAQQQPVSAATAQPVMTPTPATPSSMSSSMAPTSPIISVSPTLPPSSKLSATPNYVVGGTPAPAQPLSPSGGSQQQFQQQVNVNPFTMALNGAVDAPVNGGIPMYRRAFLTPEYRVEAEKMERGHLVEMLQRAIEEQVEIIHRCLVIHERIVPPSMRPLHEELIG